MSAERCLHDLRAAVDAVHALPSLSTYDAGFVFEDICTLLSMLCRTDGRYDTEMLRSAALVLMLLDKRQGKGT